MIETESTARVPSPCVRRCTLDPDDICVGCGRSLEEIKQWTLVPVAEQRQILTRAQQRLQARTPRR